MGAAAMWNATSLEGLASGIYVAGGKKYVVK